MLLVVCRSWQTPYFWSPEPASWRPLGFNTKQWTVNFQSKVLMETTRKTSCCNAKAGSKVWLWQMLNVDGGRGESSLLLLYNSSYNLLHRQTPFPPVAGPTTSFIAFASQSWCMLACFWFLYFSPFLSTSFHLELSLHLQLDRLTCWSSRTTSFTAAPQLNE